MHSPCCSTTISFRTRPRSQTFKHSTSSSITLNRFTALNTLLFEKMAATSLAPPPSPAPALIAGGDAAGITATGGLTTAGAEAMEGIESGPPAAPTGGSAPGTGAKKKKKGKGKK